MLRKGNIRITAVHGWIMAFILAAMIVPNPGITDSPATGEILEAYLKVFPDVKIIGVLYSRPEFEETVKDLEAGARARNVFVIKYKTPTIKDFPVALLDMRGKADTIWVLDDPIYSMSEAWSYFIVYTLRNRIRTVVSNEKALKDCGLFYYSPNKEIVVNKRMLYVLGLEVSEGAGKVKYYEPGQ
jgi:ABC-type uncharacterized transport system substrate-binding protein